MSNRPKMKSDLNCYQYYIVFLLFDIQVVRCYYTKVALYYLTNPYK
jgi:hypothetical protein